ncbi:unnamed protein product [Dracunculus medinensis]|uniref:Glycosyltransferase family 92 protein n=1 Tax=Dracunculus medinensis TaxID=318479 RepID=A0A0N4UFL8_DRAME|nr:unnamed protein product [Dracunculus medinensis]
MKPAIRILVFSECRNIFARIQVDNKNYAGVAVPIEGKCPWQWAKACQWNSFLLTAKLLEQPSKDFIKISEGNRIVGVSLQKMAIERIGLQICVPPLYWYSDYIALIQFIEIWTSQGASKFYIYYQSISRTVLNVLNEYQKRNLVELIKWRLLPKLKVDPNKSLYRLGHSLAHNDCLHRSNGQYLALVDVDEFIISNRQIIKFSSATILAFLVKAADKYPAAGSFVFAHTRLRFSTGRPANIDRWSDLTFHWLGHTEVQFGYGPTKTIFMPERTEIVLTHRVLKHLEPFSQIMVNESEARLFHVRRSWNVKIDKNVFSTIILFRPETLTKIRLRFNDMVKRFEEWKDKGCKTPYHSCLNLLIDKEDWIISDDNLIQASYIVL